MAVPFIRVVELPHHLSCVRYDVAMRASEEHDRHNEETRRLLGVLEQEDRALADIMAAEAGMAAAMNNGGLRATHFKDAMAAEAAVIAVRKALTEHIKSTTHLVRNYRILDLHSGAALDEFTVDYEVAPWEASKRMAAKQVHKYDLQEQQPDGSWLSYNPERS
ncbi:hypothetical protein ACX80V_08435 [Arthrobacter sp. MDT3-24]